MDDFFLCFQFCLMNHFFESDINSLCCSAGKIPEMVKSLTKSQLAEVSELPSVLKYKRRNSLDNKKVLDHKVGSFKLWFVLFNFSIHVNFYLALEASCLFCSFKTRKFRFELWKLLGFPNLCTEDQKSYFELYFLFVCFFFHQFYCIR